MRYEVYNCRADVEERLYTTFEADSDEEAVARFQDIRARPDLAWDSLRMIQVVVERKTRCVAILNRMEAMAK